jgi:hypothetical protein
MADISKTNKVADLARKKKPQETSVMDSIIPQASAEMPPIEEDRELIQSLVDQ